MCYIGVFVNDLSSSFLRCLIFRYDNRDAKLKIWIFLFAFFMVLVDYKLFQDVRTFYRIKKDPFLSILSRYLWFSKMGDFAPKIGLNCTKDIILLKLFFSHFFISYMLLTIFASCNLFSNFDLTFGQGHRGHRKWAKIRFWAIIILRYPIWAIYYTKG